MWLLKTFKAQQITSISLPKVFEMPKHNGYMTQMKNLRLMWKEDNQGKGLQRCEPKVKFGSHISYSRKCKKM
jgi:hypothetical protein